jgi:hypothetical protein
MALYIYSPIRLHGVELNELSRGKTLPFTFYHYSLDESWYVQLQFNGSETRVHGLKDNFCLEKFTTSLTTPKPKLTCNMEL